MNTWHILQADCSLLVLDKSTGKSDVLQAAGNTSTAGSVTDIPDPFPKPENKIK